MSPTTDPTPFIGRAIELDRLEAAARRAADELGGVVILGGEAGIGKTRLLEQFARTSRERGVQILTGGCLEFGGRGVPFAPFVEVIRGLVASVDAARLPALLGPGRRELARLVPDVIGRQPDDAGDPDVDRHSQARLFEAVLNVFERVERTGPALLIIEDVQWADEDTRDLVTFLVRHLRASRVLVILSIRTDALDPRDPNARFIGELERLDGIVRIELRAFGRRELGALLTSHSAAPVTGDRLDDVLARSGGNPFYAIHLLELGQGGALDLPPQLRDVLLVRLGDLSPAAQRVVRAVAAAGMPVDDDQLTAVLGMSEGEVADGLREAIDDGVLVSGGTLTDHPGYTFRHELLRDVAYGQLLAGERSRLHGRYAGVLEDRVRGGDRVSAATLAYHLEAARQERRAVPALIEAGAEAEHAFAFAVARHQYERALELWDRAGLDAAQAGIDRPGLLQRAAECALLTGAYDRAIELGRLAIGSLSTTGPGDPARRGFFHERLRWYLWEAGDDEAAGAALGEALRLLPVDPPSAARARALGQAAGVRLFAGDVSAAMPLAVDAIVMAVAVDARSDEAFARGVLGWCQASTGDIEGGLETYRGGLSIAEALGGAEGIALGHSNYAALLDRVGNTEASLDAALAGMAIVRRLGLTRTYGGVLLGHASKALFDLGRWDEAVSVADEGLGLEPVGLSAIWLHINHARLDTGRGDYEEAAGHLDRARSVGSTAGRSGTYAVAQLAAEADLARAEGRLEDVRAAVASRAAQLHPNRPIDPALAWLAATGLRAEADAATAAQARNDEAAVAICRDHGTRIMGLVGRLSRVPTTSADGRREAIEALCRAEARRLLGSRDGRDASRWEAVAMRWEALSRPSPAAYAWFRAGEAELRRPGNRDDARNHLGLAHRMTVELGADPLRREIEHLSRQARIELPDVAPDYRPAADGVGLTQRESEVIRLVVEGWSNQQIADALFITRKTASVHVSNIMAKLGAGNRVEAAAAAHRLGLAGVDEARRRA